jgi:hypothetical protein
MSESPDLPIWPCKTNAPGFSGYEQGLVCHTCKKRFGKVFITSIGTQHQSISSASCSECYRKAVIKNPTYEHAKAMLEWLDGKEPTS